jgi:CheY-like chemotaxis protein
MTCISLALNRTEPPEPWRGQPEPRLRPRGPGLASILVVEDNETVLEVTARVLMDAGYDVVTAGDGVAALDIIKSQPALDLLITDIRMPRMGGHVLAQQVLEHHPDLPIIYISGYASDWDPRATLGQPHIFLSKPFPMEELILAVEALLRD